MAALHDLEVKTGDIKNAYLTAPVAEKIWTVCGREFGPDQGKQCFAGSFFFLLVLATPLLSLLLPSPWPLTPLIALMCITPCRPSLSSSPSLRLLMPASVCLMHDSTYNPDSDIDFDELDDEYSSSD